MQNANSGAEMRASVDGRRTGNAYWKIGTGYSDGRGNHRSILAVSEKDN